VEAREKTKLWMHEVDEEVFGNRSIWCWLLPTPAFGDEMFIEDDEFPPTPEDPVE
jgi:hypothetical protein